MNNFDSDAEWDDQWELAWNESDWERYLRDQDEAVRRYLVFYEEFKESAVRIDDAARAMGWEVNAEQGAEEADSETEADEAAEEPGDDADDIEPYTLHKHPVFIATRALHLSLHRQWDRLTHDAGAHLPATATSAFLGTLHRGELNAVLGVQALDYGDFVLAVSHFKRALADVNHALELVERLDRVTVAPARRFQPEARMRLFDLREIWLRVMHDCREEQRRRPPAEE